MGEDINKIYQSITGVDIREQANIWDERGKGYYGEYLVFKELYPFVPGACKFLMNVEIPTENGGTTEIDLLMLHETGIYVFEMKHYKGIIYGQENDASWTQFFKTAKNCKFKNPILQNQYHIRAIKRMFPASQVFSFVVFTNNSCRLEIDMRNSNDVVCSLFDLKSHIVECMNRMPVMDIDEIDNVFIRLLEYAPGMQKEVNVGGNVEPLYQYINQMHRDYMLEKMNLEEEVEIFQKNEKRRLNGVKIILALIFIACVIFTGSTIDRVKNDAEQEIQQKTEAADRRAQDYIERAKREMQVYKEDADLLIQQCENDAEKEIQKYKKDAETARKEAQSAKDELDAYMQKFLVADNNRPLIKQDAVTVSNVVLTDAPDLINSINLSCDLTWNGIEYCIAISPKAVFYVSLTDGRLLQFNASKGDVYTYYLGEKKTGRQRHNPTFSYDSIELHGINTSEVEYIKLSGLGVFHCDDDKYHFTSVDAGYEIEIYKKVE